MRRLKTMSYIAFNVAIVLLFSSSNVVSTYPCNGLTIDTQLKNWKESNGKFVYVNSGKWDEYNDNGSLNPIPDRMDVIVNIDILSYYLRHSFLKSDELIDDFDVSVEVKFKTGMTINCTNVIDPKIIDGCVLVKNIRVNYDDFFKKGVYKTYIVKRNIKIRELLSQKIEDENVMLSQIIILTKIKTIQLQDSCLVEYILPICS